MSTYTTQELINVSYYRRAMHPAKLIEEVEQRVRRTLEGAPAPDGDLLTPAGDVRVGWLARIPGDPDPHTGRATCWESWTPGEEIPEGADELSCRGRRIA